MESEQRKAFKNICDALASNLVLAYFDPTQQTEVHVDSSKFGIGCVLVQNEHPIAYGSYALTPTQQKYSPIEKEMLALLVECNKFHQYLYGAKNVLIITDHKPFEAIFKKGLTHTPTCLAKMVLQLRKYGLIVKWKPGKSMFLPDTLSRAYLASMDEDIDSHIEVEVHMPQQSLPMTNQRYKQLQQETRKDQELQLTMQLKMAGLRGMPVVGKWGFWDKLHSMTPPQNSLKKISNITLKKISPQ